MHVFYKQGHRGPGKSVRLPDMSGDQTEVSWATDQASRHTALISAKAHFAAVSFFPIPFLHIILALRERPCDLGWTVSQHQPLWDLC